MQMASLNSSLFRTYLVFLVGTAESQEVLIDLVTFSNSIVGHNSLMHIRVVKICSLVNKSKII